MNTAKLYKLYFVPSPSIRLYSHKKCASKYSSITRIYFSDYIFISSILFSNIDILFKKLSCPCLIDSILSLALHILNKLILKSLSDCSITPSSYTVNSVSIWIWRILFMVVGFPSCCNLGVEIVFSGSCC